MKLRLAYLSAIADSWANDEIRDKLVNANDILPILNSDYRFDSPWKCVELHIVDDEDQKTEWKPAETAGWIGANDEFILNVPNIPEQNQQVQALTAYYEIFPTLFGSQKTKDPEDKHPLPTELGANAGPFLEFGGVNLRAIALAWKNQKFLKELTLEGQKDASPVLSKYLGYRSPWNFSLRYKNISDFKWNGKSWDGIPKNIIKLHYPRKPEDEQIRPIALTSYNNTGPAYPFSCV